MAWSESSQSPSSPLHPLGPHHHHLLPDLWSQPPFHSPRLCHCPVHRGGVPFKCQIRAFAQNAPMSCHLSQNEKVKTFSIACKVAVLPGPVNSKSISHSSLPNPWCSSRDGLFVVYQTCQAHPHTGTFYWLSPLLGCSSWDDIVCHVHLVNVRWIGENEYDIRSGHEFTRFNLKEQEDASLLFYDLGWLPWWALWSVRPPGFGQTHTGHTGLCNTEWRPGQVFSGTS